MRGEEFWRATSARASVGRCCDSALEFGTACQPTDHMPRIGERTVSTRKADPSLHHPIEGKPSPQRGPRSARDDNSVRARALGFSNSNRQHSQAPVVECPDAVVEEFGPGEV